MKFVLRRYLKRVNNMKINHLLFDQDNVLQSKYTKSEVKRFFFFVFFF